MLNKLINKFRANRICVNRSFRNKKLPFIYMIYWASTIGVMLLGLNTIHNLSHSLHISK